MPIDYTTHQKLFKEVLVVSSTISQLEDEEIRVEAAIAAVESQPKKEEDGEVSLFELQYKLAIILATLKARVQTKEYREYMEVQKSTKPKWTDEELLKNKDHDYYGLGPFDSAKLIDLKRKAEEAAKAVKVEYAPSLSLDFKPALDPF